MLEIPFDGENSDLELEEEEIKHAGELGCSTNPVNSSGEDEVEEPQRKRRRKGRENTGSSSVQERLDSSESDGTDTDLFAEESNNEDFISVARTCWRNKSPTSMQTFLSIFSRLHYVARQHSRLQPTRGFERLCRRALTLLRNGNGASCCKCRPHVARFLSK